MDSSTQKLPLAIPALLILLSAVLVALLFFTPGRRNTPPGPRPLPFIGNLHQLPATDQHKTFAEWGARYGEIVYARFFYRPVIILNSARAALDLMEKRGAKYSGRPPFTYTIDLVEWHYASVWMSCTSVWKQQRKWFQQMLTSNSAVVSYHPLHRREANRLLLDISRTPDDFEFHMKRFVAAMILELGYGRTVTGGDDDFIRLVEKGVSQALSGTGTAAGNSLVDYFPILRFLPSWFPGAGFQKVAASARKGIRNVEDIPFETVQREMAAGTAKPSFTKSVIELCQSSGDVSSEMVSMMKGAAGTLYVGGTDTVITPLLVFVLQMALHPEILARAQEEVDRVVGDARLPDFDDRPLLPYIDCIERELFRFCPSGPLGIPHQLMEDDEYQGYFIPKGTMVIANIWAMMRDPEHFPDPEVFRPERYLEIDPLSNFELWDPKKLVFGFGRRSCPGSRIADNDVWLVISRMIATMDIRKARDEHGVEITPNPVFRTGTVTHPDPFPCDIRPRSEKAKQLILDSCALSDI